MGYELCPKCEGKKYVECVCVASGRPNKLCEQCKGSGKVRCQSCDGKGTVYIGSRP